MNERDKLEMMKTMTGETDETVLFTYLHLAGERVLQKAYPFHPQEHTVPRRYAKNQVDIACYLYNKRGAEGETSHQENGINRTYESAGVPESMLAGITPFVGVI